MTVSTVQKCPKCESEKIVTLQSGKVVCKMCGYSTPQKKAQTSFTVPPNGDGRYIFFRLPSPGKIVTNILFGFLIFYGLFIGVQVIFQPKDPLQMQLKESMNHSMESLDAMEKAIDRIERKD